MKTTDLSIGVLHETSNALIFFGNRDSSTEAIQKNFPSLELSHIHQVHGPEIIPANDMKPITGSLPQADAHWTNVPKRALCIKTADCLPVMIFSKSPHAVFSIHAGWKGVAQRIVPVALEKLKNLSSDLKSLEIYIGPHIFQNSFEVELPVKNQLLDSMKTPPEDSVFFAKGNKFHVDLAKVVRGQISEFGLSESQIRLLASDTKTDLNYHSYRRDRENAGRQMSFIALLE